MYIKISECISIRTHVGLLYFLLFFLEHVFDRIRPMCMRGSVLCNCLLLWSGHVCNLGTRPLYTSSRDVIILRTNFSFAVARAAVFMC